MAELLDDIASHLVANGIGALYTGALNPATATAIYLGLMRDEITGAVALIEVPGTPPDETFGENTGPVLTNHRLQVFARHDPGDYLAAQTLAKSVWTLLTKVANATVNGTRYTKITSLQTPTLYEWDDVERAVFLCQYNVQRVAS